MSWNSNATSVSRLLDSKLYAASGCRNSSATTLDRQPDFSPEVLHDWRQQQQELWGDHFSTVQKILGRLQSLGIFYADPKPGNIMPENWNPEL